MTDDFEGNVLPDFSVDEHTLDLLWTAMHPGPDAELLCIECEGEGCDRCDGTGEEPELRKPAYRLNRS